MRLEFKPQSTKQSKRQTDEFEPTRSDVDSAKRASGEFVKHWRDLTKRNAGKRTFIENDVSVSEEKKAGVSFRDINAIIGRIAAASSYFLSRFGKLPCFGFQSGDMPLCSAHTFFGHRRFGNNGDRFTPGEDDKELIDAQRAFLKQDNHPMMVEIDKGEEYFRNALTRFLAYRIGGYPRGIRITDEMTPERILDRQQLRVSGADIFAPGDIKRGLMMVRVTCKSSGLRVHSSPAYFVDWSYFGDPSNPDVDGWLLPGRYIFATDGACPPDYVPDSAVFPIPEQYNPHTKQF